MSRSYRKTPKSSITKHGHNRGNAFDKRCATKSHRRAVKMAVSKGEELIPLKREVSDVWMFAGDGKSRFDPVTHPELMRK